MKIFKEKWAAYIGEKEKWKAEENINIVQTSNYKVLKLKRSN